MHSRGPIRRGRWRKGGAFLSAALCVFLAGCEPPLVGAPHASSSPRRISLLEIGELALETGERLESRRLYQGAREAYSRAVWAFSYHHRLTGDLPLLMDEARDRLRRLGSRARPAGSVPEEVDGVVEIP